MAQNLNTVPPQRKAPVRRRPKLDRPNPIDVHVGARVRLRRTLLGLSQEKLGEAIGLTFQQVQKYERGANRVSFSRCVEIAHVLNYRISDLVSGIDGLGAKGLSDPAPSDAGIRLKDGPELLRAYVAIPAPVRRAIINLLTALADTKRRRRRPR